MKYDENKLETKRLILRKAKESDLKFMYENIWSDKTIADKMIWKVSDDIEDAKERMIRTINYQSQNYAYFVCLQEDDIPIGFAGVFEKEKGIYEETGICIATKYQGKGLGKEVLSALENLVFNKLDGKKFFYTSFSTNTVSKRLCLSRGFKYLGSEEKIREHDNKKYTLESYYLDKDMYSTLSEMG